MHNKAPILILFLLTAFIISAFAQEDSVQNLYIIAKNLSSKPDTCSYLPGKKGFYIYRNCIYDLILQKKEQVKARIIDIRNDSIYYTPYFNKEIAIMNGMQMDTLRIHPSQIKMIRLINDAVFGGTPSYSLAHSRYVFEKSAKPKKFEIWHATVNNTGVDSCTMFELVTYMTGNGIDRLYERGGHLHPYNRTTYGKEAGLDSQKSEHRKHNWVWFTPSGANEINGLNISLQTMNVEEEPLVINGVNTALDLISCFMLVYSLVDLRTSSMLVNMPDTVDNKKNDSRINGLSVSMVGLIGGGFQMNGVSLGGGVSMLSRVNGLAISGFQNIHYSFNGINIAGLRNWAMKGRGIQIGALNVCKNLKGIQIGLWNVNSRRSLPFINWCFKPKIKA